MLAGVLKLKLRNKENHKALTLHTCLGRAEGMHLLPLVNIFLTLWAAIKEFTCQRFLSETKYYDDKGYATMGTKRV
jgi:hypothetical protein